MMVEIGKTAVRRGQYVHESTIVGVGRFSLRRLVENMCRGE